MRISNVVLLVNIYVHASFGNILEVIDHAVAQERVAQCVLEGDFENDYIYIYTHN